MPAIPGEARSLGPPGWRGGPAENSQTGPPAPGRKSSWRKSADRWAASRDFPAGATPGRASLRNLDHIARHLLQALRDGVPVDRAQRGNGHNQQVQSALREIRFGRHCLYLDLLHVKASRVEGQGMILIPLTVPVRIVHPPADNTSGLATESYCRRSRPATWRSSAGPVAETGRGGR